jgi:hypothetical protein
MPPKDRKPPDTVRKRKLPESVAVQNFLPIAEIKQDCVVLKNGGIRAILEVGSVNFSLKSEDEQMAILSSYQAFVNTIAFPIQVVIRSNKVNVDGYLQNMRALAEKQENPLLKENTLEYCAFIERLIEVGDIMQKRFYIAVPMDGAKKKTSFLQKYLEWLNPGDTKAKALARQRQFEEMARQMEERVNLLRTGLEEVGLTVQRLKTADLIQLFYSIYNHDLALRQKFSSPDGLKLAGDVL